MKPLCYTTMRRRSCTSYSTCRLRWLALLIACLNVFGCAAPGLKSGADAPSDPALGESIAQRALALVGRPYAYGGADLQGFDCSGLVYFIHQALGIVTPRTAAAQQQAATRVNVSALRPGDLVFFRTGASARITHVGVYVGNNRFVHAPASGKLIESRALDDKYWASRLISAGRLHSPS